MSEPGIQRRAHGYGFRVRAKSAPRNDGAKKGLLPERIGQLSADFGRNGLVVHPIIAGKLAVRHPERSEQHIPDRKGPGEIGIATLLLPAVIPPVEYPA